MDKKKWRIVNLFFRSIPIELSGIRRRIELPDGFSMSLQASTYHYCDPQNDVGPYTTMEIGYPLYPDDIIAEYADEADSQTLTVYPHTPVDVIFDLIDKHGGIP